MIEKEPREKSLMQIVVNHGREHTTCMHFVGIVHELEKAWERERKLEEGLIATLGELAKYDFVIPDEWEAITARNKGLCALEGYYPSDFKTNRRLIKGAFRREDPIRIAQRVAENNAEALRNLADK